MSLRGFDCSHYQNSINWQQVKNEGYNFVIAKASQGISKPDPTFHDKISQAKAEGLIVGAYGFFDPTYNGIDQANFFLKQLKPEYFPMLTALDVEQYPGWDKLSLQQIQDVVMNQWLDTVQAAVKAKPLIYSNISFIDEYLKEIPLGNYPLWLSAYVTNIPLAWKTQTTIWQSTGQGKIPGIDGYIDIDCFEGEELTSFLAPGPLTMPA